MKEYLLPNHYKKIAFVLGLIALASLIFQYLLTDVLIIEPTRLEWIIKDIILISLLGLTFSKEKNESKKIKELRLKDLKGALGFGVFVLIFDSVQELIFWDGNYEMKSGYEIMAGILLFHLIFFTYRKSKLKNHSDH